MGMYRCAVRRVDEDNGVNDSGPHQASNYASVYRQATRAEKVERGLKGDVLMVTAILTRAQLQKYVPQYFWDVDQGWHAVLAAAS
jgi:hypothetical protein